jgi:hypothetical protein
LSMNDQSGLGRAEFSQIDMSQPVALVTAELDGMDATDAIPDGEVFVVRQVDEDGKAHTLVLSEKMVMELTGLMNAWITLQ